MTNWTAIGIVTAAEVAVLLGATIRCFSAKGRIDRERDGDIRSAIAGYEVGQVIPAVAELVGSVIGVIRSKPSMRGALDDGDDVADTLKTAVTEALDSADTADSFKTAVDASVRSRSPRAKEKTLVYRYTTLGVCLVACQLSGPAALYNVLTVGYNLPHTAVIVASVIFALGVICALVLAILVALGEIALARVIRDGKDAA